jgi:hypothetical protein
MSKFTIMGGGQWHGVIVHDRWWRWGMWMMRHGGRINRRIIILAARFVEWRERRIGLDAAMKRAMEEAERHYRESLT